jgi:uroporphyrinogen-III decarboxylase
MNLDSAILLFDLPYLFERDFSEHNRRSAALWKAFAEGTHDRIPIRLNTNPRMLMLDPKYNVRRITYEEYMGDPEVMAQAMLEWQYWTRFLLPGDHEKGFPEKWTVRVDFENHYDAGWFGCPVHYRDGQVPDTTPILRDGSKRLLFDRGIPDPFAGEWPERCLRFMETFQQKAAAGWTFLGKPVVPDTGAPFMGCDGVFTAATSLRGATELCLDLLLDPDYARELLDYVYTAVTARMKAWRDRAGLPVPQDGFGAADDGVELLSTEQYREFVLPLHRRLFDQFGTQKNRSMHLCGNVQRHLTVLHRELGVTAFDTGFPIDFAQLRRDLGLDAQVSGGPRVTFFLEDSSPPIIKETERILGSGILRGGRFILQEANNLPPGARLDVCRDFYATGKRLGRREMWR